MSFIEDHPPTFGLGVCFEFGDGGIESGNFSNEFVNNFSRIRFSPRRISSRRTQVCGVYVLQCDSVARQARLEEQMGSAAREAYDGHYSARYGIIYEVRTAGAIIQRHLHPNKHRADTSSRPGRRRAYTCRRTDVQR